MKQLLLVIFILILNADLLHSKELDLMGYYISQEGDTIECKLFIPLYKTKDGDYKIDMVRIQQSVKAVDNLGNKIKIKPSKMKEYFFAYDYSQYFFQSVNNDLNFAGKNIFLHRIIDGKLKLFNFYTDNGFYTPEMNISIRRDRYCIQKEGEKVYKLTKRVFNDELKISISDCPKLLYKYGTQDYEYENINRIIMEYNDCEKKQ